MTISTPITDDDVEAFVSDRLDPERRAEVDRWLSARPERLAEVRLFQEQQAALRRLADDMLGDPIPDRLLALLRDERCGGEDGQNINRLRRDGPDAAGTIG